MIPKIIHYCWLGGKVKPVSVSTCIDSWKEYNPEYSIIEWSEENFDLDVMPFVREAYSAKKYAFVSDVVRVYALLNFGGIYLDTDIEMIRPFSEDMLAVESFIGFEHSKKYMIGSAVIGSVPNHPFWFSIFEMYKSMNFIQKDGSYNDTPNVNYITGMLEKYGLECNNKKQNVENVVVYPNEFFSPKDYVTKKIVLTSNTITIHHFSGTWQPYYKRLLLRFWIPFSVRFPRIANHIKRLI